jgi:hypothetical protein
VDGISYDVEFLDGTCIALYNGCDDVSDFTFQTSGAANVAANALLDQVFLPGAGGFGGQQSNSQTNGCRTGGAACELYTPYGFFEAELNLGVAGAHNVTGVDLQFVVLEAIQREFDTSPETNVDTVFAVWSVGVVPEPGTGLLMGLGLLGLSVSNRRQR